MRFIVNGVLRLVLLTLPGIPEWETQMYLRKLAKGTNQEGDIGETEDWRKSRAKKKDFGKERKIESKLEIERSGTKRRKLGGKGNDDSDLIHVRGSENTLYHVLQSLCVHKQST